MTRGERLRGREPTKNDLWPFLARPLPDDTLDDQLHTVSPDLLTMLQRLRGRIIDRVWQQANSLRLPTCREPVVGQRPRRDAMLPVLQSSQRAGNEATRVLQLSWYWQSRPFLAPWPPLRPRV